MRVDFLEIPGETGFSRENRQDRGVGHDSSLHQTDRSGESARFLPVAVLIVLTQQSGRLVNADINIKVITAAPTEAARAGSTAGLGVPTGLEKEPDSSFSLVDPVLKQARSGHVSVLVTQPMCLAHVRD